MATDEGGYRHYTYIQHKLLDRPLGDRAAPGALLDLAGRAALAPFQIPSKLGVIENACRREPGQPYKLSRTEAVS
eukprot:3564514-Heterocapsa_arctica.AAC.1